MGLNKIKRKMVIEHKISIIKVFKDILLLEKQIKDMSFIKKYQLVLGNWVCLIMSVANVLRDYIEVEFETHPLLLLVSFVLVYFSMMLIWTVVFAFLKPKSNEDYIYRLTDIIRLLFYCLILIIPFIGIGYFVEMRFSKDIETFDKFKFIGLYALRVSLEYGLVLTFKYISDNRELAKSYIEESHKLKEANSKAQYEILKNQVNPHFLFNALSTLKSLIRIQDPQAEVFVMRLSDVYRKLLTRREQELIHLNDEMDIVNSYLFMQQLRFENNLVIKTTIPTSDLELFIPPFALQLLIENTIKHNIISQRRPLSISIFVNEKKQIVVENTKQPKKTTEESTGWGLSSLMERYEAFTPNKIEIKETESLFSVALPLLTEA
jgi:two-component system, LytTR family, sensor kinase